MLRLRYHIKDVLKIIFIMIFIVWYLIEILVFNANLSSDLGNSVTHKKVFNANLDYLQLELIFAKSEIKEIQSLFSSVSKQKNKFNFTCNHYSDGLSFLIFYKDNRLFLFQKVDNIDVQLRSPPYNLS
jgi:hypothetical protein